MPDRNGNSGTYRYGFNGQEKDDEIQGSGNTYTAQFWEYDSRLGRRWNLDPVDQISISNYACFANNPIWYTDRNGDKVNKDREKDANGNYTVTKKQFRQFKADIRYMRRHSESFKAMYNDMKNADELYTFRATSSATGGKTNDDDPNHIIMNVGVNLDPSRWQQINTNYAIMGVIAHEAGHAWRHLHNLDPDLPLPKMLIFPRGEDYDSPERLQEIEDENYQNRQNHIKAVGAHNEMTERAAMHIENIVIGELRNSGAKMNLSQFYESSSGLITTKTTSGQIEFSIGNVIYDCLQFPRDENYYLNTKFDIHRDHGVKPIQKRYNDNCFNIVIFRGDCAWTKMCSAAL